MQIERIDHLVLTAKDIEKNYQFYQQYLGMEIITLGVSREDLIFDEQKINLNRLRHMEKKYFITKIVLNVF